MPAAAVASRRVRPVAPSRAIARCQPRQSCQRSQNALRMCGRVQLDSAFTTHRTGCHREFQGYTDYTGGLDQLTPGYDRLRAYIQEKQ